MRLAAATEQPHNLYLRTPTVHTHTYVHRSAASSLMTAGGSAAATLARKERERKVRLPEGG